MPAYQQKKRPRHVITVKNKLTGEERSFHWLREVCRFYGMSYSVAQYKCAGHRRAKEMTNWAHLKISKERIKEDPNYRKCSRCALKKPLDAYYTDKKNVFGRQTVCKSCRKNQVSTIRRKKSLTRLQKPTTIEESNILPIGNLKG